MSTILRKAICQRIANQQHNCKWIFTVAKPTTATTTTTAEVIAEPEKIAIKPAQRIATMNDLPVPCGSWLENHNRAQKKYNTVLFAGVISVIMAMMVLRNSDGWQYFRNWQHIEGFEYHDDSK